MGATFYEVSSVDWTPYGSEYFNTSRELTTSNVVSSNFIISDSLTGIEDVTINNDTIFYLTKPKLSVDLFNNTDSTTAFNLSSFPLSTTNLYIGNSAASDYIDYYQCSNTPEYNKTVDIRSVTSAVNINYILYSPYKHYTRTDDIDYFQFNVMTLKNIMTPYYDYDSNFDLNNREYKKIYTGTNQNGGYNDIYLGFDSDLGTLQFKSNVRTYFHYPYNGDVTPLSSSFLIERGAKPGDSPINSDIVSVDQYGYNQTTNSGPLTSNKNGQFLCAWLSGSNDCGCSATWMERWYDPNTVTQGAAYITQQSTASCIDIWDVPSSISFIPKVRYYYDRFGNDRNYDYIDSLSSNLIFEITNWTKSLSDNSGNNNNGFILESYDGSSEEFELDGKVHAHIPPTDSLLDTQDEITVSTCVYKEDWCCGHNSQIVGNYHLGGWGLFYNTGINNSIITVGDDTGGVYSFNSEGVRIFEKQIGFYSNISIDYIITDLNGARWILDKFNNKVYKLDVDDVLTELINFPVSYDVVKIQINSNNQLYALDINHDKFYVHDELGNFVTTVSSISSAVNFEIDKDDNIVYSDGDQMAVDYDGNVYKTLGTNLYKNDVIIYHFRDRVTDIKLDQFDNVWLVYSGNVLVKLNSDGEKILETKVTKFLEGETSTRLGITRESNIHGCDVDRIWLVFEKESYIAKLNTDGEILELINSKDAIKTRNCEDFGLRAHGDFTGFDVQRKFNVNSNGFISNENPSISLKIKLTDICGNKLFKMIHAPSCGLSRGWHSIAFTFSSYTGEVSMFLDGAYYEKSSVDSKKWFIDYNTISPIVIGGNSGKLGSENTERSIIGKQFFIGKIKNLLIYNKSLPSFTLESLSYCDLNQYSDLTWNFSLSSDIDYIERIDRSFMMKKPGHISRFFNIKINGLDSIDDDLKSLIEDSINSSINNIIPAHSELKDIVWN